MTICFLGVKNLKKAKKKEGNKTVTIVVVLFVVNHGRLLIWDIVLQHLAIYAMINSNNLIYRFIDKPSIIITAIVWRSN